MSRDSTTVESRWRRWSRCDGSVRSSAGTYTAWIEVIEADLGRRDALLQAAHFLGQRRLVPTADGMRPSSADTFGTGQRVAVDVVDEEQHVAAFVAEGLGDGQAGQRHAQTVARGSFIWP